MLIYSTPPAWVCLIRYPRELDQWGVFTKIWLPKKKHHILGSVFTPSIRSSSHTPLGDATLTAQQFNKMEHTPPKSLGWLSRYDVCVARENDHRVTSSPGFALFLFVLPFFYLLLLLSCIYIFRTRNQRFVSSGESSWYGGEKHAKYQEIRSPQGNKPYTSRNICCKPSPWSQKSKGT